MKYVEQRFVHMLEMLRLAKQQCARSSSSPLLPHSKWQEWNVQECMQRERMHASSGKSLCKRQECMQEVECMQVAEI